MVIKDGIAVVMDNQLPAQVVPIANAVPVWAIAYHLTPNVDFLSPYGFAPGHLASLTRTCQHMLALLRQAGARCVIV